jgi:hypothetical protein
VLAQREEEARRAGTMSFAGRRKSSLAGAGAGAKQAAASSLRKGGGRTPLYVAGVLFFLCVIIMYSEDIRSVTLEPLTRGPPKLPTTSGAHVVAGPRRDMSSSSSQQKAAVLHRVDEKPKPAVVEPTTNKAVVAATPKKAQTDQPVKKAQTNPVKKGKGGRQRAARKTVAEPGVVGVPETCDLSKGKWVFDNTSYPLYKEHECQFLTSQVTCTRNGRRDDTYQKWRWQPRDCNMPRYGNVLQYTGFR